MGNTGDWKGKSVKDIVPELNPLDTSSLFNKAKDQVQNAWGEISEKKNMLDDLKGKVDDLYNKTAEAKGKLDNLFDTVDGAISNTQEAILNTGIKYNTITAVGEDDLINTFENSLNISPSQDPEVPIINNLTAVGMITIVATSVSTSTAQNDIQDAIDNVNEQLNSIKSMLKGLN
ncbi:MAG: hypothetical protein ACOCRK_00735 [bacterium]